jgi:hypothetical protein
VARRDPLIHSVLAYQQRPLLKAVLLRDMDVLGRLVRRKQAGPAGAPLHSGFIGYLAQLREHGWIRTDQSLAEQVNVVSAVFVGFFVMTPVLPGEFTLADETAALLLADAACRAVDKYRAASTCWGRRAPDERYPGRTVRRAAGRRQCRSRPGRRQGPAPPTRGTTASTAPSRCSPRRRCPQQGLRPRREPPSGMGDEFPLAGRST